MIGDGFVPLRCEVRSKKKVLATYRICASAGGTNKYTVLKLKATGLLPFISGVLAVAAS